MNGMGLDSVNVEHGPVRPRSPWEWLRRAGTILLAGLRTAISERPLLAVALGIYVAAAMALLISSNFLPYVTDNNESFSSYVHARNMLRFGFWHAAGLTDEAYAPQPAAHPYVYTHEGNFPRFPVYLLMLMGVRSIEWQIALHALVIGTASMYLCFRFFSRLATPLFALMVCAVLSTDYLLFMQWEVNTFRVWQGFFFFLSLVCVQSMAGPRPRWTMLALFTTALGLFYFEVVFAAFTAVVCVAYTSLAYRPRRDRIVRVAGAVTAGAVVAIGGLVAQTAAFLGWTTTWRDLRLTVLSRNFSAQTLGRDAALTSLRFFQNAHIVWWENSPRTTGYLSFRALEHAIASWVLRVDTPYFILLVWTLTVVWGVRLAVRVRTARRSSDGAGGGLRAPNARHWMPWRLALAGVTLLMFYGAVALAFHPLAHGFLPPQLAARHHRFGLLGLWFWRFSPRAFVIAVGLTACVYWTGRTRAALGLAIVLLLGVTVNGIRQLAFRAIGALELLGIAMIVVMLQTFIKGAWWRPVIRWLTGTTRTGLRLGAEAGTRAPRALLTPLEGLRPRSLALGLIVLFAVALIELNHDRMYQTTESSLWHWAIEGFFLRGRILETVLLSTLVLALAVVLGGRRSCLHLRHDRHLLAIIRYLAAGAVGFLFIYILSPGYLTTGYLSRYAPLPVFILDVWIALFFYMLILIARDSVRAIGVPVRGAAHRFSAGALNAPHVRLLLSAFLIVFGAAYWARIQTVYIDALPPTQFLFLRQLGAAPFKGATFISNTYAAPISYYTEAWAYDDDLVSEGRYKVEAGHTVQVISGRNLWEADRASNPDYAHPQYYLCIHGHDVGTAAAIVALRPGERLRACSDQKIVRDAALGLGPFSDRVVAADSGPQDGWAIVRLDPARRMVRLY